jgi:hypothetical protein
MGGHNSQKGKRRAGAETTLGPGAGRGRRREAETARIWCGAVQEASKDILAPAAPDGNEGGCSTLAVVSTGLAWYGPRSTTHANCNCGTGAAKLNKPAWEKSKQAATANQ